MRIALDARTVYRARRGCTVYGVEINKQKLHRLAVGQSPVRKPGLQQALGAAITAGRFRATDNLSDAVAGADLIMIAVGTPGDDHGSINLDAIDSVVRQLATIFRGDRRQRVVMVRSTVPPGTVSGRITPALRAASPTVCVCHHPEFLREGSGLSDFLSPAMIVTGSQAEDRPYVAAMLDRLYAGIDAPRIFLDPTDSELLKYACNLFHAVKIDFANEMATLAAAAGADGATVMRGLCADQRLNISTAYLQPGFTFGGSCLTKDTRALVLEAQRHGLDLPLTQSVLESNRSHLQRQTEHVLRQCSGRRTLLIGLSFKAGTDDLRESPMLRLAESLLPAGVALTIFDPDLCGHDLVGANARHLTGTFAAPGHDPSRTAGQRPGVCRNRRRGQDDRGPRPHGENGHRPDRQWPRSRTTEQLPPAGGGLAGRCKTWSARKRVPEIFESFAFNAFGLDLRSERGSFRLEILGRIPESGVLQRPARAFSFMT